MANLVNSQKQEIVYQNAMTTCYYFEFQQPLMVNTIYMVEIVHVYKFERKFGRGWIKFKKPISIDQAKKCVTPVTTMVPAPKNKSWEELVDYCERAARTFDWNCYHAVKVMKIYPNYYDYEISTIIHKIPDDNASLNYYT